MPKSKTTAAESSNETPIDGLPLALESPIASPLEPEVILFGWVLCGGDGRFVDKDSLWVANAGDALFFTTAQQASEYNENSCEGLYQVVAINV